MANEYYIAGAARRKKTGILRKYAHVEQLSQYDWWLKMVRLKETPENSVNFVVGAKI